MLNNINITYEIIYKDTDRNRKYITTDNMDLIQATEKLKEYSKEYKNCRLLEIKTITREVYLDKSK